MEPKRKSSTLPMQARITQGFTLVEMLVIAPIIILFIGAFIALIVSLTGESIQLQASNSAAYNTQDALDDMEASTLQTVGFLTTTGSVQSPQGKNDNTTAFTNDGGGTNPDSLIISSAATTKGPYDSTRSVIYTGAGECNAENPIYTYTTVYFVDTTDNALYKRTILPQVAACDAPWQKGSCKESLVAANPSVCKVGDEKLLENVTGMTIQYYSDGASSSPLPESQASLASSIEVTVATSKQVAGKPVAYSASARMGAQNIQSSDTPQTPPAPPPIATSTNVDSGDQNNPYNSSFSWSSVGNATGYTLRYRINGSAWTTVNLSSSTTDYDINTDSRNKIVEVDLTVNTQTGSFPYGTASTTNPRWQDCDLQSSWGPYGGTWPSAQFTRTSANVIMLRGLIAGGSTTTYTVLCTLPVGFRPDKRLIFQAQAYGSTDARIDVDTNGQVIFITGSATWTNLSDIKFVANNGSTASKALTGVNSWVNYGAPYSDVKLLKDGLGRGFIEGLARNGSTTAYIDAFSNFSGGYNFTSGDNIYTAMGHGNSEQGMQLTGDTVAVRSGFTGNSFWSLQGMFYPTGSTTWQNATLANSWVNYGGNYAPAGYTKGADDIVSLQGLIRNGTVTSGTTLFTLPVGYRPIDVTMCSVVTNPDAIARIDINTNGTVVTREGVTTGWLSLAGCEFMAS